MTSVLKKTAKILLMILLAIVVLVGVVYLCLLGRGGDYYNDDGSFAHVDASNSFNHIMNHPALDGMGDNILPLGSDLLKTLTGPWKLKIMIPFLGKHEETVVNALNYAIDCAENEESRFLSFYSEQEKSADPYKEETGLLFYKTQEDAPFVLICPGGGFTMLGVASSGYPYIEPLRDAGYNVFVLKYRVGLREGEEDKTPAVDRAMEDMYAALAYICQNADTLGVNAQKYLVLGSSAGGQLTARYCAQADYADYGVAAPSGCIMLYPANCQKYDYTNCTTPMYITVCEDDPQIDVAGLDVAVAAMLDAGVEVSYNKFETGGHSFGIGVGTPAEGWMERSLEYMSAYIQ